MSAQPAAAPRGKPSQYEPIEIIEIVAWRGELGQLLALLRIDRSEWERGLKGKTGIRRDGARTSIRVELRNRAPVIAALRRKLQGEASE